MAPVWTFLVTTGATTSCRFECIWHTASTQITLVTKKLRKANVRSSNKRNTRGGSREVCQDMYSRNLIPLSLLPTSCRRPNHYAHHRNAILNPMIQKRPWTLSCGLYRFRHVRHDVIISFYTHLLVFMQIYITRDGLGLTHPALYIANGPDGTVPPIPAFLIGGYGGLLALESFFGEGHGCDFDWFGHDDVRLGVEGRGVGVEEHSVVVVLWSCCGLVGVVLLSLEL